MYFSDKLDLGSEMLEDSDGLLEKELFEGASDGDELEDEVESLAVWHGSLRPRPLAKFETENSLSSLYSATEGPGLSGALSESSSSMFSSL